MAENIIDSPRSPRVRAVAALSRKATRSDTGLFLLEGPQAVTEALTYRPELVLELFVTPWALERYEGARAAVEESGIEYEFASEEVIEAMSDTVTPQGFVAVCRQFPTSIKKIFAEQPKLIAILEEVRDPGNAGTIIRAADSAGADAVILTGRSVDLYNPKVVRSTTGSLFHLPVAVDVELDAVVQWCRKEGVQILAADVKGAPIPEVRDQLTEPTAWLFGNEARGLTEQDLEVADHVVQVPIYGKAESMNLATAASVCLYQSAFSQRGA